MRCGNGSCVYLDEVSAVDLSILKDLAMAFVTAK